MTQDEEIDALSRMNAARNGPENTCPASRHAAMIAEALIRGEEYSMLTEDPYHCGETIAVVVAALWVARSEIPTLRAQLADQKRLKDRIIAESSEALEAMRQRCDAETARANRAEAAQAAQIEVDAGIADAEIFNTSMLTSLPPKSSAAFNISAAIRSQHHDRSALDRMREEAREKALREAAALPHRHEKLGGQTYAYVRAEEVLALIDKGGGG